MEQQNVLTQIPKWFVILAAVLLLFNHTIVHLFVSPIPDEAYYWLWGQNLDWSYYDHPPLNAWTLALSSSIFGNNLFSLRLPSLVSSITVMFCLLWWAKKIDGRLCRNSLLALIVAAFSSPIIFIFTAIAFNDHLMIALLSVASILIFITLDTFSTTGHIYKRALYGAAILIGLAGLTKYNAVLFAIGVFIIVLWIPKYRPLLRSKHIYFAAFLCLAWLAPVFWWNYTSNAASFHYNLVDRIDGHTTAMTTIIRMMVFIFFAALSFSPIFMITLISPRNSSLLDPASIKIWRQITVILFLTSSVAFFSITYFVSVLYYWNIVAYIAVLPFAALSLRVKWHYYFHVIYGLIVISLYTTQYSIIPFSTLYNGSSVAEILYGWQEVSSESEALHAEHNVDFVMASDYRTGSILAFLTENPDMEVISERISQFTLWFDQEQRAGQDALILTGSKYQMNPLIADRFETIEEVSSIPVTRFGYSIKEYKFYVGRNYLPVK